MRERRWHDLFAHALRAYVPGTCVASFFST